MKKKDGDIYEFNAEIDQFIGNFEIRVESQGVFVFGGNFDEENKAAVYNVRFFLKKLEEVLATA